MSSTPPAPAYYGQPSDQHIITAVVFGSVWLFFILLLLLCTVRHSLLDFLFEKISPLFSTRLPLRGRRRRTDHQSPQEWQDIETGVCSGGVSPEPDDPSMFYEIKSSQMDGDCCICLREFEEGHERAELHKCKHTYHRECIDLWLPKPCPLCRQDPFQCKREWSTFQRPATYI